MVYEAIKKLVCYGLENHLISEEDRIFTTNRLLEVLKLEEYEEPQEEYKNVELEPVLKELLDYAYETGVLEENGVVKLILPLIYLSRRKIRRQLQRQKMQNKAVIQNACYAWKTRDMQEELIILQDRIIVLFR